MNENFTSAELIDRWKVERRVIQEAASQGKIERKKIRGTVCFTATSVNALEKELGWGKGEKLRFVAHNVRVSIRGPDGTDHLFIDETGRQHQLPPEIQKIRRAAQEAYARKQSEHLMPLISQLENAAKKGEKLSKRELNEPSDQVKLAVTLMMCLDAIEPLTNVPYPVITEKVNGLLDRVASIRKQTLGFKIK
jgi:hypothetical protein